MATRALQILLVEDHVDTANVMARLLKMGGYEVFCADAYRSALAAARQPFDLMLCDIRLPDGHGADLLHEMRERGPVRAIAMTASADPIKFEDLRHAINRVWVSIPSLNSAQRRYHRRKPHRRPSINLLKFPSGLTMAGSPA